MIVVGSLAFTKADAIGGYMRHVKGSQMDGMICGQDGEFGAGLEYKYSMQMATGLSTSTITDPSNAGINSLCVKTCPLKIGEEVIGNLQTLDGKTVAIKTAALFKCSGNPTFTSYCTPYVNLTATASTASAVLSNNNVTSSASDYVREMMYDVNDAMGAIWGSLGFAVLFSFVFLLFVKIFAGITIFIAIFTGLAALLVTGYFFFFLSTCTLLDQNTFESCGTFSDYQLGTFQFGYIAAWSLFVILLCIVVFMRHRILLAIKLMKQAVSAINAMKMMLVTPLLMLLPLIVVLVWWLYVCVAMASAGDLMVTKNVTVQSFDRSQTMPKVSTFNVPVSSVVWSDTMYGLFYYHIFGLLWTLAFFIAAMNFMLSSATSQWYFAENVNGVLQLGTPVLTGITRAFGIHGGTMAFGSFLVAVFETIRMVVDYLAHKARKESGQNIVVRCLCCIAQCCVRCFEKCVKFITSEAYVFTALFVTSLCPSVGKTFAFIGANMGRIGTLFKCFCLVLSCFVKKIVLFRLFC
jgi:hypothetical protein